MASTSSRGSKALKVYYGSGELEKLKSFERVVIQPAYYCDSEINSLKASGVMPLAYLSLGEDPKEYIDIDKPYRRKRMNVDWETHYVYVNSPEWQNKIQAQVRDYIARGFQGFLLDSLDVVDLFPDDRPGMLKLIKFIRQDLDKHYRNKFRRVNNSYLIANRGFALLPEMTSLIDATIFEGFSTKWTQDGQNEVMSHADLQWSAAKARELELHNIDRYALDYCHSYNEIKEEEKLERFAIERAQYYGLTPLVSNRALTDI